MKNNFETPWLCTECGYGMDCASCPDDPIASPVEDDVSICMNCGHLYIRHADKWVEPTQKDKQAIPDAIFEHVNKLKRIRAAVIKEDLAKQGSRH